MLQFNQVTKSYGSNRILEIPSFKLDNGIFWLKGPNGSGKTTLLQMIAGIRPFVGDILLEGYSLRRKGVSYRQRIGWADAEPLYPAFLTGEDLLRFYTGVRSVPAGQGDELTRRLSVQSFLGTPSASWSSGMTKKVSLLLAFLGRPSLLLLDEPMITLDMLGESSLFDLIREWRSAYGTAFLISSHQEVPSTLLPDIQMLQIANKSIYLI